MQYGKSYKSDVLHFGHGTGRIIAVSAVLLLLMGSLLIIAPDTALADTKPGGTLLNDRPARTNTGGWWWTGTPDELLFKVPTKTNYYTGIAVLNRQTGEDFDLFAYDDYDMSKLIASSTKGSDVIDFVVIDGHTHPGAIKYSKVYKFTGSDWRTGISIESDYHCVASDLYGSDPDANGYLEVGTYRHSMFEYHSGGVYSGTLDEDYPLINTYDIYLEADGEYDFDIGSIPNTERLAMYLIKGSGSSDDALAYDKNAGTGGSLSFSYSPDITGYYGLAVIDENQGYSSSDDYTILISSDFEMSADPSSKLIGPGMNASFDIDVNSLGITKDIDLHYRWQNSAGTNITTPAGASAGLNRNSVTPEGVGTETAYLNVTTTSSLSAGTYYLTVYGNDTGVNGKTHYVTVTLKVSTNPDFFLLAEPELVVVSPGTSGTYGISMDTINSFTSGVTLSASTSPSHSSFSFAFDPATISSSNSESNLTVKTTSSTPIAEYSVIIKGTSGTMVRYANASLRVKKPIDIQVISPSASEIVSGIYSFKVKAGSPPDTDSVSLTFGGKMENMGTISMFYNSESNYWERTVNTFSYNDGLCWINVTAMDLGGGITVKGPVNFTLSNSAPNPIITTPLDRSYVTGNNMPISVNTSSQVISVRFRIDQNAWNTMTRDGNTWSGSWDTTLITDGTHTLTVEAKDNAGLTGQSSVTIFVDNTRPTCNLNSPIDGQYIEGSYTFRVVSTDTVGVNHVDITIFGDTISLPYNTITSSYEYTVATSTKTDGSYKAYATAYDNVNQSKESSVITFYIDNNDPSLSILSPDDGEIIGGNYSLSVLSSDIFLNNVRYQIDSTGWNNFTGTEPDFGRIINTSTMTDGYHSFKVRSTDNSSHVTEQSIDFIVDNTNPTCSLVIPFEGAFVESVYNFKVSASDSIGIDKVTISVFSDTFQTTFNRQTGYYEYAFNTLTMTDGIYNITASAFDLSGKLTNSTIVSFKVDNNAPDMAVNNLQKGDYISGIFNFDLSVYDAFLRDVKYSVDGGGWNPIDTVWNTTEFDDGEHRLTIRADDESGKSTVKFFDVMVDNIGPTCTVNSPAKGEFVEGLITIKVTAFDIVGIDYVIIQVYDIVARVPYNANTGYYEYSSNTITWGAGEDGVRNVTATAYDFTVKTYTFGPVSFNVDNRAPTINIYSPKEGEVVSGLFFFDVLNGDVFKKSTDYNVDGASWQPVSIGWDTTLVPDGMHEITIRATDKAGHITYETIHVYVDNHAPEVTISTPNEGQFVEGTFTFRIAAFDDVGIKNVRLFIAGDERVVSFNQQTGYYEYLLDTRSLTDGTYTVNCTVTDVALRKVTSEDTTFNVDNNAPDLFVEAPMKDQLVSGTLVLRAQSQDEFPLPVIYSIDGTTWYELQKTPWNTTKVGDGYHTVTIKARDQAGHYTEFDVNVIVDNTKPMISQATVTPGQILSNIQTLRFYVYDSIGIRQTTLSIDDSSPFEIFRGEGGLYYEYLLNTRNLKDGSHNLTLTAVDRAGNSVKSTYTIKTDNTGPGISLDYYWVEGDQRVRVGQVKEGNSVVFVANITDPSGVEAVWINIDSGGWREMTPDSNESNPDTFLLYWPTTDAEGGAHVFQIRTVDKVGNEATRSGLINVKEKKEKTGFFEAFNNTLPFIWFILFLLLLIALGILAYTGILTRWAKGEGMKKKEDTSEGEEEKPRQEKAKRVRNPFKKTGKEDDSVDWSVDEKKE